MNTQDMRATELGFYNAEVWFNYLSREGRFDELDAKRDELAGKFAFVTTPEHQTYIDCWNYKVAKLSAR